MSDRLLQIILSAVVVLFLMVGSCAAGSGFTLLAAPQLRELDLASRLDPPAGAPSEEVAETFDIFWEAWRIVEQNYVNEEQVEPQGLTYGAIRGMLDSLEDVGHTRFLTPEELAFQQRAIQGSFAGIGAEVAERDGQVVIVAPMEGSPAEEAGIRAGDIILAVDGESTAELDLTEVIALVRGEPGTPVTLTVVHPDEPDAEEITIIREEIELPAARWTMLPGDVAYIKLNQFSANLHEELLDILEEAEEAGAERYLVDVRNNPGGLVNQVIAVTSEFLPEGIVFIQRERGGETDEFRVRGNARVPEAPVVVLTNRGSASAAEIFAGALRDQERAVVVGETTFGTGTVLNTFTLSDGSAMLLGVAEWLTPDGVLIKGNGIEPNVPVELPLNVAPVSPRAVEGLSAEELEELEDTQFLEGYEILLEAE